MSPTVGWYAAHPRAFEEAVESYHDREMARYEAEQDRLEAEADEQERLREEAAEYEELTVEDIAYLRAEQSAEWEERHGGGL